jgi:predicted nuclease with TOPRIM domain
MYGPVTPHYGPMAYSMSKEDEIAMLEEEAKFLEEELTRVKKRLDELKVGEKA